MNISESEDRRSRLRRKVAAIGWERSASMAASVPLGHAAIDVALGGGLARGRLHEIFAGDPADAASASGVAAMLARRLGGGVIWLRLAEAERRGGLLYPHGLAGIGIDPAALALVQPPDTLALLRAAAEVVRCPEAGTAVIELWGMPRQLDLTVSRRFALAAEASGVTALLLRVDAATLPSAAHTRWEVRAAPSSPLDAGAPGHPAFDLTLLRQRGRPAGGRWHVAWNRDHAVFDDAGEALSGAVLPLPARRPMVRGGR